MCSTTTRWWSGIRPNTMQPRIMLVALLTPCATHQAPRTGPGTSSAGLTHGVLHLHCTWTEPYCGGAEPDPSDYRRPAPWAGRMFMRAAITNSTGKMAINDLRQPILDSIRMDSAGHGYLTLPVGQYLLLDRDRVNDRRARQLRQDHTRPAMYTEPIDTACLRQWLHGPFGVLSITSGDTLHMEYPMHGQCPWYATPCVRYNGPLPP